MRKIPIYILAGGRSERFGSNKARAVVDGKPLILHVAQGLEPAARSMTAIGRMAGEYGDLGLRTIADRRPEHGPMGGLQAAIEDLQEPGWLMLAACDWLGVRSEWVGTLLDHAREDVDCVYFDDGRPQPLFALYRHSALPVVESLLDEKRLAMQALIERLRGAALDPPDGWIHARNVNTRVQLKPEAPDKN